MNYETGGLCDKLFCKEAIVDGDLFLDRSGLTCKMQRFEVSLLCSTFVLIHFQELFYDIEYHMHRKLAQFMYETLK